jgi:hypothetical protein
MSRHEAGLIAASTAAEPLIDIAYFNALFPTSAPSSGQRASRFACNEVRVVYAGEGTPWVRTCGSPALVSWTRPHTFASDWHPASVLPLLGVRKIRRAYRGWDWLPVAQAKERFAKLNGGNPWVPQLTKLSWPAVKSIDVDRLQMKKLRDDALRRGYDALRTRKPTWLMKRLRRSYCGAIGVGLFKAVTIKCVVVLRPAGALDPEARWLRSWLCPRPESLIRAHMNVRRASYVRGDDGATMIEVFGGCYVSVNCGADADRRPEIRADLQDEIIKLQARGGSLGVIRDATRARGLQIDDDGVSEVLGPAGYMFGEGDPSANALMDDETEAFNAEPGRSLPEKVRPRGGRPSHPRYGQRITYDEKPRYLFVAAARRTRMRLDPSEISLPYHGRHPEFRIDNMAAFGVVVSFSEVASLWNERPKATTSVDAIDGYSEDPDWQAQHLRQKAMSTADYDAVAGVGRSVRTGPEPRRLPNGTAKQNGLTRDATELIELNPAQSDIPEQQIRCEDWWAAAIRNYAYGRDRVFVDAVARHVSKKFEHGKFGKKEQLRIGKIFVFMGWEPWRAKNGRGFVNRDRHHFSQ